MRHFKIHQLILLLSAMGVINAVHAAGFQLYEQDGASVGNYHAGRAAIAEDASTSFYNPAGLIRIKNQQVVTGIDPILTDIRFKGTIAVPSSVDLGNPQNVTAQGGGFNAVPFLHYAAPISDSFVFGLSVVAPYGLKTDYGRDTLARYSADLTSVRVVDYSPTLAIAFNQKLSIGFGLDIERMHGDFNQAVTGLMYDPSVGDSYSKNSGEDTAYGYHLGALFQCDEATRLGLSYHSQVVHHLKGNSDFTGPLANSGSGGLQRSDNLKANVTLPPTTTLSAFHAINPTWDVMGSVMYIQWGVMQDLILQNVSGAEDGGFETLTLPVVIHEHFHNTWNYALGANYHVNENFLIRTGAGYDQTPVNSAYRDLQMPDSDRYALAVGGHYQATKTIGLDLSWTHLFAKKASINNNTQTLGDEVVTTNGKVNTNADVYGLQVTWNII